MTQTTNDTTSAATALTPITTSSPVTTDRTPSFGELRQRGKTRTTYPLARFSFEAIQYLCKKRPGSNVEIELDHRILIFEARSNDAVLALYSLDLDFTNAMMLKAPGGFDFFVRLEDGVHAKSSIRKASKHPDRIGVRAAGSRIILHCNPKLRGEVSYWERFDRLPAVGQPVVDAVLAYNDMSLPRPPTRATRFVSTDDLGKALHAI